MIYEKESKINILSAQVDDLDETVIERNSEIQGLEEQLATA